MRRGLGRPPFSPSSDDVGCHGVGIRKHVDDRKPVARLVGAGERSRAGYEHFTPAGWEIYGRPNEADLKMMRQGAKAAGVDFSIEPEALGGFLRTTAG
jgi:hypothetical protein